MEDQQRQQGFWHLVQARNLAARGALLAAAISNNALAAAATSISASSGVLPEAIVGQRRGRDQ